MKTAAEEATCQPTTDSQQCTRKNTCETNLLVFVKCMLNDLIGESISNIGLLYGKNVCEM